MPSPLRAFAPKFYCSLFLNFQYLCLLQSLLNIGNGVIQFAFIQPDHPALGMSPMKPYDMVAGRSPKAMASGAKFLIEIS